MKTCTIFLFGLLGSTLSADILAVFPHTGKSHFDVFQPLILSLAERGHSLTVLSFFPQKTPVPNLTDISLVGVAPLLVELITFNNLTGLGPLDNFIWVSEIGFETCKDVIQSKQVQNLLKSKRKFDLMILEIFNTDCFFSFSRHFSCPSVALSSCNLFPHHNLRIGNPDNLAFASNVFYPMSRHMDLVDRVVNVVSTWGMQVAWTHWFPSKEQTLVERVLDQRVVLKDVVKEVSMVLVNSHHSIQGPRPTVPALVEVGGLHIGAGKPNNKELENYLNDSPDGVLLFSMGSVLQSSSFPDDKRQAFMDAFAELPVRVLMKWESDTLPGKPDNVRLSRWLPQRDILAHPKVRAFMGHGGLLSTSEAVYCGVPMVLIPMFGDQPNNVAHLQSTGAAVRLPYSDITKDTVLKALRAVLNDPSYKQKAMTLSEQYRDRPMAPLDTAVYWTEYVIRHKGARHLRSPAVDMPWYQLWLLDVLAALLAFLALGLALLVWAVRRATRLVSTLIWPDTTPHHRKRE